MIMQKLYKQFEAWVTKWKINNTFDEFFVARIRLTFYYSITALIILGVSSIILYNTILSNLSESILEDNRFNPQIARFIIDRTQDILISRFLTINFILIICIIVLGFFLSQKTLKPIKSNMEKQKRFIADASHELRTPIAVIISGLEVNLNNKKLDDVLARKVLEDTLVEVRDLSVLTNNLLDISKYDTQKQIEYEILNISDLVKEIVGKMVNLANDKNIIIETNINSLEKVRGNKIALGRVVSNILDNAIKYSETGGLVQISEKISLNRYILKVNDNGKGISKNILNKIFDPFFRGDISRNKSGAGLGLALSKKIIEDHRGTISIKSELNKGTTVIISLPLFSS